MLLGHTLHTGEDCRSKTQATNNQAEGLLLRRQSPLMRNKEEARNDGKRDIKINLSAFEFLNKDMVWIPFYPQYLLYVAA